MPEKSSHGNAQQAGHMQRNEFFMTFEEFYRIVKRRQKGIALTVVFSFASAFGYHFLRMPEYHAVSLMMINDNSNKDQGDLFSKFVSPEQGMIDNTKSVKKDAEILKSMAFAEIAVKEIIKRDRERSMELFDRREYESPLTMMIKPPLPLMASDEVNKNRYTNEDIRRFAVRLNKRINVEPLRETNIIKISIASPFPDEAAYLSNAICRVYRDLAITQNSAKYAQANRFISTMLQQQGEKLADADAALSRYMAVNEIYESSGNTGELLKQLVDADAHYNDIQSEYNIAKNNLKFLNERLTEADKEVSYRISQNVSAQLGSIMDDVRSCESDYVRIVRDKGIDSPEAKTKKQQLDLIKARYDQLSRSKIAGQIGYIGRTQKYSFDLVSEKLQIERKLNELSFSSGEFGRLKKHYEAQLGSLPVKQQEYIRLQRDREAISKTYVFLKEKLDESRILIGSEVGSVSIVGEAFKPLRPDMPDLTRTLLLAFLFSGVFASAYAYGAEKFEKSVMETGLFKKIGTGRVFSVPSEHEISRYANLYDGAGLPLTIMTGQACGAYAESMRAIRAFLDAPLRAGASCLFMVSGTASEAGKSTVCASLAIAWSLAGWKTLVVDCDMERPSQHELLDGERVPGLSDWLEELNFVDDNRFFQSTRVENLSLLSAGTSVLNSSDLIASAVTERVVESLRERFDVVLFDAPSISTSDSLSLSHYVDGIIIVAQLGRTAKKAVMDLAEDACYGPKILCSVVIEGNDRTRNWPALHHVFPEA